MHATCARAVAVGLPALAFTEHVDLTPWARHGRGLPDHYRGHVGADGRFLGAPLDVAAYLAEIDRCRCAFPGCESCRVLSSARGIGIPVPLLNCWLRLTSTGSLARCTPWSIWAPPRLAALTWRSGTVTLSASQPR